MAAKNAWPASSRTPIFARCFAVPESEEERKALVARWHKEKTAIYQDIIDSGKIPPRPGIKRLSQEALDAGWKLAVASTSAPAAVSAVLRRAVGELAGEFLVLSGDIVPAKKPAPDIYNLTLERLHLPPENCVAVEDSRNGMLAAYAAHIPVIVTVSAYTEGEKISAKLNSSWIRSGSHKDRSRRSWQTMRA